MIVICDFDGTLTDSKELSRTFLKGYLGELSTVTGRPVAELYRSADRIQAAMKQSPREYDWTYQGNIVSTTLSDPSLRFIWITEGILDDSGHYKNRAERDVFLHELFMRHYPAVSMFRPHVAQLFKAFAPACHIVSNSSTTRVEQNVVRLCGPSLMSGRIQGNARKQFIDHEFDAVPVSMTVDGHHRPVLLRRKHYYDAINGLLGDGLAWSDAVVLGDNFELDLALPMHLGARGVLVANEYTPPWELAFIANHPRGQIVTTLRDVLDMR